MRGGEHQGFIRKSLELRWSDFVEPRMKVHRIDEGYTWVLRMRDFTEDSKEESREIEVVGFRRLSTRYFTLQEVGILHNLVYFPLLGRLKGCLGAEN